jgi:hypothetical protein
VIPGRLYRIRRDSIGLALVSDRVRSGFEPAAVHQPFGAAFASVNVNRRRKRWARHDGDVLGGTTSVGAQVVPSGAANSGTGRPGPVQQRNHPGNREQQNRTASSRGQVRAGDSSFAGGGLRTETTPGISGSG